MASRQNIGCWEYGDVTLWMYVKLGRTDDINCTDVSRLSTAHHLDAAGAVAVRPA